MDYKVVVTSDAETDFYDKNCLMGSIIKCPNVKSDNKSKFITDT